MKNYRANRSLFIVVCSCLLWGLLSAIQAFIAYPPQQVSAFLRHTSSSISTAYHHSHSPLLQFPAGNNFAEYLETSKTNALPTGAFLSYDVQHRSMEYEHTSISLTSTYVPSCTHLYLLDCVLRI